MGFRMRRVITASPSVRGYGRELRIDNGTRHTCESGRDSVWTTVATTQRISYRRYDPGCPSSVSTYEALPLKRQFYARRLGG